MLKKLLLLTLVTMGMQSACSPGCSQCVKKDSGDVCQICDLSRFYYLEEDGTCVMNALVNCKIPSPTSTSKMCIQCNDEHFFDELAQECVAVPESKKDSNCAVYSLVADCLRCKSGYIVQNGSCVVPSNVINNCQWQITEEHCETCDSGYQLSVARTTCLSFSTINNCEQHQEFQCARCKSNYSLAVNWHLLSTISLSNLQESLSGDIDMAISIDQAKEDCVEMSISNCVEYDSYGRCALCDTSYHVDPLTGNCALSREPEIFKCRKYSDVSTCAECDFGFYLDNNKCIERSIIDHCVQYTVNANSCDECTDGYYSALSSCALRNVSANIDHCKTYYPKQDKCQECEQFFILSTDFIKCFRPIDNCQTHEPASSSDTLFCDACEPEAVPTLNSNVPAQITACEMRDNLGCIAWSANNSNECTTCLTGFYWLNATGNLCQPYTKKCKTYDAANDSCASCFADQYLHETTPTNRECRTYTVRNCDNFEPAIDECNTCRSGYYKDSTSNDCHPYTLINCASPSPTSNECGGCNPGFYKADAVSCLPEDLWECAASTGNNTCQTCNQGYYLDSNDNKCYASNQTGCVLSSYTTNKDECTSCEPGFYNDQNKFCKPYTVSNCMGSTNNGFDEEKDECTACLPNFYLDANKNCLPIQIPHCDDADTTGANCTKCAVGYYKDSTSCLLQYVPFCRVYTPELNECTTCLLGYELQGDKTCTKVEITHCMTYNENAATCDVCESGYEPNSARTTCLAKDVVGCLTYSNGVCNSINTSNFYFDGSDVKPKTQPYCQTPDANAGGCTTCVDGYERYDDSGTFKCRLATVTGCALFNTTGGCIECKNGFYSTGSTTVTCTAITSKSNCMTYSRTADVCTVCEPGFIIAAGSCTSVTAGNLKTLNCEGNSGTADTSGDVCNTCPNGSLLLTLGSNALVMKHSQGILSYDASGNALQLDEGYIFDTSVVVYDPVERDCIQLVPNTANDASMSLTTSGKCGKCRNQRTHWLASGDCNARTNLNCSKYDPYSDNCLACKEGLAYAGSGNNTCTEAKGNGSTNCKYTNPATPGCYECNNGHIVNSATNLCVSNSTLKNCRMFNGSNTSECTHCSEGAYLNKDTNLCVRPNTCITGNGGGSIGTYCEYCLPGFAPHTTSRYECSPAHVDDVCAMYKNLNTTAHESICVKCKDPTTIPFNLKDGANYKFRCVPNLYPQMENTFYYQDGATLVVDHINTPNKAFSSVSSQTVDGIQSPTRVCQPLDVPHCKTYDFAANRLTPCTMCEDGYYLENIGKNGQQCLRGGIGGCLKYTARDNCSECETHWILKTGANAYCEKIEPIKNCEVHHPTEAKCIRCAVGYLLLGFQCQAQSHTNCKYYDFELDNCFGCDTDFFLKDGTCHPYKNTNCLEFARTEDMCNQCAPNYYLKDGNCLVNDTRNCHIKSSLDNHCIACNNGFFLERETGKCQPNVSANCLTPDIESPNCLVCSDGYFLLDGICSFYSIQNCSIKDSEQDKCLLCHDGFYLNGLGSCERYSVKHCKIKDPNANLCRECKPGYFRDSTGICGKYTVKNCNVYNNYTDQCLSCLPGHYKNSKNDCVKYNNLQNCETADPSKDACVSCKSGYYNDFGICRQYSVSNCALFKPDADLCTTCKSGYFLFVYTCEPYTVRCEQYKLTENKCLSCAEGYYLDEGICYVNNGLFCKELSPFRNGCESCVDGFYLDNGQCKIREHSNNCKEAFDTADLCKSCFDTHYIAGGMCISYALDTCKTFNVQKDLCMECETGKYWMSHHVCEPYTVDHCEVFDPNADKCTQCEVGKWYLDTSTGVCLESTEVDECKTYSNTQDACSECEDLYYLVSGSECRRNPSGLFKCIQYKDENTCVKCETGFYLENNYCQKSKVIISNCANYSGEAVCESCESTHLLLENLCVEKIETSCATWVDGENCLTCPSNKVIKTNDDSKKVCEDSGLDSCVEAEAGSVTNVCLKCGDKKLLNNGICTDPTSPLNGCKVYAKEGECSECDDGYTLTKSNNGCVSNFSLMSANCAAGMEKSSPVCHSCMSGYHLDANRECLKCGGEGCNVCDPYDSTKCIYCMIGYDHDGSSCTKSDATVSKSNRMSDHFKSGFMMKGVFMMIASFMMTYLA